MKYALIFVVLSVLLSGGCTTTRLANETVDFEKPGLSKSQEETWALMLGKWYGDQPTKDGGRKQWVVERLADGKYAFNLTGWPATVIRAGTDANNLPIGVQIISRPHREDHCLAFAKWLENRLGTFPQPPFHSLGDSAGYP